MNRAAWFGCCAIVLVTMGGCASVFYQPTLSLGQSPLTIPARVKMNQFRDASPPDDKGMKVGGSSATEPGTMAGDLPTQITNAVLTDFSNNQVFERIQKRMETPDLILNGTIHRFYGKSGINTFGWITLPINIIWLLGLPMQSVYGAVDLEVSLQQPNGRPVATYRGKSEFSEYFSMYTNVQLASGTGLNKAFNVAIEQIRSQIMADVSKLSTQAVTRQ